MISTFVCEDCFIIILYLHLYINIIDDRCNYLYSPHKTYVLSLVDRLTWYQSMKQQYCFFSNKAQFPFSTIGYNLENWDHVWKILTSNWSKSKLVFDSKYNRKIIIILELGHMLWSTCHRIIMGCSDQETVWLVKLASLSFLNSPVNGTTFANNCLLW